MKTQLLLHSSDLMKVLEANPEVLLGLQSMAAEKVAEEITRKTANKLARGGVERVVNDAVRAAEAALRARWSFPKEAEIIVRTIANEAIQTAIENAKKRGVLEMRERLDMELKEALGKFETKLDNARVAFNGWVQTEVRKMARDEFISVMREVKSAI